jgi:hypothetical protein
MTPEIEKYLADCRRQLIAAYEAELAERLSRPTTYRGKSLTKNSHGASHGLSRPPKRTK